MSRFIAAAILALTLVACDEPSTYCPNPIPQVDGSVPADPDAGGPVDGDTMPVTVCFGGLAYSSEREQGDGHGGLEIVEFTHYRAGVLGTGNDDVDEFIATIQPMRDCVVTLSGLPSFDAFPYTEATVTVTGSDPLCASLVLEEPVTAWRDYDGGAVTFNQIRFAGNIPKPPSYSSGWLTVSRLRCEDREL